MSFRELSYLNSMRSILRQQEKIAREISNKERMLRSFERIDQTVLNANSARNLALGMTHTAGWAGFAENRAAYYSDLAKRIVPESMRFGFRLAEMRRSFASMGHYSRLQSDAHKYGRMFGNIGLSSSVAQAFEVQRLASSYSEGWRLQAMRFTRTSALQSILKATSTFGPVLVPPDYDDETPFDYHPDLQGWLIPNTATESRGAADVEELWTAVVAWAQGIAVHHHTEVLLSVLGDGKRFLIRVSKHPVVVGTVAGTAGGFAEGVVSGNVAAGVVKGGVEGGVAAVTAYILTRE